MRQVQQAVGQGQEQVKLEIGEQLRERGKSIVELSQKLVTFERERILNILKTLKAQLF
jgi:hypothetical protein